MMTMHKSKGLEYHTIIFLLGSRTRPCSVRARDDLEEGVRLLRRNIDREEASGLHLQRSAN